MLIILGIYLMLSSITIYADQIKVVNETNHDAYVAIYYVSSSANRITPIFYLKPHSDKYIDRPERKFLVDRQLALVQKPDLLAQSMSREEFSAIDSMNIGNLKGKIFHINDMSKLDLSAAKKQQLLNKINELSDLRARAYRLWWARPILDLIIYSGNFTPNQIRENGLGRIEISFPERTHISEKIACLDVLQEILGQDKRAGAKFVLNLIKTATNVAREKIEGLGGINQSAYDSEFLHCQQVCYSLLGLR